MDSGEIITFAKIFVLVGVLCFVSVCSAIPENSTFEFPAIDNQTPIITIDPFSDRCVNDTFTIRGRTNLPAGTDLLINVYRGSYNPGIPPQRDPWYDHIPGRTVVIGNPQGNLWSYSLNTAGSYPDEYLFYVKLSWNETVQVMTIFNLSSSCSSSNSSPSVTTTIPSSPQPTGNRDRISTVSENGSPLSTGQQPTCRSPLSPLAVIAGLSSAGLAVTFRKRKV